MARREVDRWVDGLAPEQREAWEERAAIMEYDGGLARDQAELEAARIVRRWVDGQAKG